MIIAVNSRQPNFNTPKVEGTERSLHPLRKLKVKENTLRSCKLCGYKHPFTRPPRCPAIGKKCSKCKRERAFCAGARRILILKSALKSAEGSQVAAMERETAPNHNVHTYFGFAELNTVFDTPKKFGSLITVKIVGKDVQTKQILVQRLPSSPMN